MTDELDYERSGPGMVEVRTPARLHLGMLSFGRPEVRSFGGVGVMVDRPGVHVRLERAEDYQAAGPLGGRAVEFARLCAEAWELGDDAACAIDVLAAPRPHVGLGSGTQLALAVAAGMRQLFRRSEPARDHDFDVHPSEREWLFDAGDVVELARAVGRGRRSCVGLHGFSRGGLIVEAGRFVRPDDGALPGRLSPMVARVRLPSDWRCLVIVRRDSVGLYGDAEKTAFARLPPVPAEISAELSRLALMELLPAAIEGSFAGFSDAVHRYGLLAGRPFEQESARLPYARATARLIEWLDGRGVRGAAQSSWGPAVMACCQSLDAAGWVLEQFERDGLGAEHDVAVAEFDSQGAVLRVID